jgi:tetratricopeptide (TPR) repeat protein
LHGLALVSESSGEAIRFDRQALQLDSHFILSHLTIAQLSQVDGHDETEFHEAEAVVDASAGSNSALSRHGEAEIRAEAASFRAELQGDYVSMIAAENTLSETSDSESRRLTAWRNKARASLLMHDLAGAADLIQVLPAPATQTTPEAPWREAESDYLQGLYRVQSGDWRNSLEPLEHIRSLMTALQRRRDRERYVSMAYSLLAEAYARVGRGADADAVLGLIPLDVYAGWCAKGRIATLRHDYAAGEKAFTEAVRQAPSIPRGFLDWGDMLAAQGDLSGAIAKYTEANRLGPHWAEPLKAWGDVLSRQGQSREALKKYRQALQRSPQWTELKALAAAG